VTDEERYQELLDLLSRGLIRYAEKHGLLERLAKDLKTPAAVGLLKEEAGHDEDEAVRAVHSGLDGPSGEGS